MDKTFFGLCRTGQTAGAAADGLFFADGVGAANRTGVRKNKLGSSGRTFVQTDADNLRDNIAGALDNYGVADADIFTFDLVFVVKGGVRNHYAADIDRFQIGNGREGAGAADLNADIVYSRQSLFGRKFVRNRPTRRAR